MCPGNGCQLVERTTVDDSTDRILESLSQINVNLESLRVSLTGVIEIQGDHEDRLRIIERWKYGLTPLLTWVAFILGGIANAIISRMW